MNSAARHTMPGRRTLNQRLPIFSQQSISVLESAATRLSLFRYTLDVRIPFHSYPSLTLTEVRSGTYLPRSIYDRSHQKQHCVSVFGKLVHDAFGETKV